MKRNRPKRPYPKNGSEKLVKRLLKEMGRAAKPPYGLPASQQILNYAKRVADSNAQTGQNPKTVLGVLRAQWPEGIGFLRETRKSSGQQTTQVTRKQFLEFAKKLGFLKPGMNEREKKEGVRRALSYLHFLGCELVPDKSKLQK